MTPYYDDGTARIWHTDALTCLRQLEDESVNCCVTSPPYDGLRNYGVEGQLGLEGAGQRIRREVGRRICGITTGAGGEDGTLWLNLGDSFYNYRTGYEERSETIAPP